MTTLLRRGFGLLNRGVGSAAGESVRYIRGATVISDAMPAILSAAEIELITNADSSVIGRQFRFRLKRSELLWEGAPDRPKRSDKIEWIHESTTYVFEVLPEIGGPEAGASDPRNDWIPASVKLIDRQ